MNDDANTDTNAGTQAQSRERSRLRLSQETIAILTVGVALAALILTAISDIRTEARTDRAAWQAESRQLRDRADARFEALQREILRLTEGQARLAAIVETDQ